MIVLAGPRRRELAVTEPAPVALASLPLAQRRLSPPAASTAWAARSCNLPASWPLARSLARQLKIAKLNLN